MWCGDAEIRSMAELRVKCANGPFIANTVREAYDIMKRASFYVFKAERMVLSMVSNCHAPLV